MKKVWAGMLVGLVVCIIYGCSKDDKIYQEMIKQGHQQVEKGQYARAENFFIKALEEKPEDETAKILLKQTRDMLNAQKRFDEGNFEAAVSPAKHARTLDGGSEKLREKAKGLLDEMKKMRNQKGEYSKEYEKAKQLVDEGSFDAAIETLKAILENNLRHPFYTDVRDNSQDLLAEAETAKEKAAAEAEAKARAEAKAKAEAKAEAEEKAEKEKDASKSLGAAEGYWLAKDKTEACHLTSEFLACAVKQSDVMFQDKITGINHKSDKEIELTFKNGHKTTLVLAGKDSLITEGGNMDRVSKEEANAIYEGFYELP